MQTPTANGCAVSVAPPWTGAAFVAIGSGLGEELLQPPAKVANARVASATLPRTFPFLRA